MKTLCGKLGGRRKRLAHVGLQWGRRFRLPTDRRTSNVDRVFNGALPRIWEWRPLVVSLPGGRGSEMGSRKQRDRKQRCRRQRDRKQRSRKQRGRKQHEQQRRKTVATLGLIEYQDASAEVREVYDDIMATRKTD